MKSQDFPELVQFFGAYFHQDCLEDDPTDVAIVKRFVSGGSPEFVAKVHHELVALQERALAEADLMQVITELGAFYDPRPSGLSYRQWLDRLIRTIEEATRPV